MSKYKALRRRLIVIAKAAGMEDLPSPLDKDKFTTDEHFTDQLTWVHAYCGFLASLELEHIPNKLQPATAKVVIAMALLFFEELVAPDDDENVNDSEVTEEADALLMAEDAAAENIDALRVSVGRVLRKLKRAKKLLRPYIHYFEKQGENDKADFLGSIMHMIVPRRVEATLAH